MMLPLIMMGVWIEAGASGRFAMSEVGMARYFIAAFIVRNLTVVWVIYEFEWSIITGRLSPLLLQPMDPSWRFISMHLSEQLARLPLTAGLVALCLFLFPAAVVGSAEDPGVWLPQVWQIIAALAAAGLAFLLRYLLQYTLAMLAFWVERAAAFEQLIYLPYLFLSGMIAPLEVFPPVARELALLTPFPYMLWFPCRLLIDGQVVIDMQWAGRSVHLAGGAAIAAGFAVMAVWAVVLYAVNRMVWRRGLRHYSAMGA
jgi:ABC-2 type transport system permease protein